MNPLVEAAQPNDQPPLNRAQRRALKYSSGFYTLAEILAIGKFSKSHAYNLIARGHFPQPVLVLGPRFTRWSAQQCDEYFEDPAGWIASHGTTGGAQHA